MKRGLPPTAPKARTGEVTPPGVTRSARANHSSDNVDAGTRPSLQTMKEVDHGDVARRRGGERVAGRSSGLDPRRWRDLTEGGVRDVPGRHRPRTPGGGGR